MAVPHAYGNAAASYQEQEILNESPLARVARLFEMAALEIARARAALAAKDWAVKGVAISRSTRCISLLQCSLDLEQGGEVAENLDRLYTYLLIRISQAHLKNDDAIFREVWRHLSELGSAWREVVSREGQAEPAAISAPVAVAAAAR